MTAATAMPEAEGNSPVQQGGSSTLKRILKPVIGLVAPVIAVIAAMAVGAIMLLAFGANPLTGYAALFSGAVGGWDNQPVGRI